MKISKRTLQILKNYSDINQSIVFHPGNILKTVVTGNTKDFFGTSPVEETFTTECAIYDIRRFLNCLALFIEPDVEFTEHYAVISDGKNSLRYTYVDKSIIDSPDYSKTPSVKKLLAEFSLSREHIQTAIKAAGLLSIKDVKIVGTTDGQVRLIAADVDVEADNFNLLLAEGVEFSKECTFESLYSVDRLRMLIDDDYTVRISEQVLTEFTGDAGVVYHHGGLIEVSE
jgi:hypothetical protein